MLFRAFLLSLLLASVPLQGLACPRVNGFQDLNCDGKFTLLFIGDSVVAGVGDQRYPNKGGYVRRLARLLPSAVILRIGVPGISTFRLYQKLVRGMTPKKYLTSVSSKVLAADVIVFDVGRNDYYDLDLNGVTDEQLIVEGAVSTVRAIRRMVIALRTSVRSRTRKKPHFNVATLLPTRRSFQRPFIEAVNTLLLTHISADLPVEIPFNTINVNLMTDFPSDGIHPSDDGYIAMARMLKTIIAGKFGVKTRTS